MKAEFSIKFISYFAPNCPRRIVAPNCPAPNCPGTGKSTWGFGFQRFALNLVLFSYSLGFLTVKISLRVFEPVALPPDTPMRKQEDFLPIYDAKLITELKQSTLIPYKPFFPYCMFSSASS